MTINFKSGYYSKAVNTYHFNEADRLHNAVLEDIQDVWNAGRHQGYVLEVSCGDCRVNIEKYNDHIDWYNPVEKISGKIWDCKVMSKSAWLSVWNYIMNHFGIPKDDNDLEWENINAYSEFLGEQQAKFEEAIEADEEYIKECEEHIAIYVENAGTEDLEMEQALGCIDEEIRDAWWAMENIIEARNRFIDNMSKFTSCSWGLGDCYADTPVISTEKIYFEVDEFDLNEVFDEWLNNVLPYEEKYIDLKSTLYHYFACA